MTYVSSYTGSISQAVGAQKPDAVLVAFRLVGQKKVADETASKPLKTKPLAEEQRTQVAQLLALTALAAAQPGVMEGFRKALGGNKNIFFAMHPTVRSADGFCRWSALQGAKIAFLPVFKSQLGAGV